MPGHNKTESDRVIRAKANAAEHFIVLKKAGYKLAVALLPLASLHQTEGELMQFKIERFARSLENHNNAKIIPPFSKHNRYLIESILRTLRLGFSLFEIMLKALLDDLAIHVSHLQSALIISIKTEEHT